LPLQNLLKEPEINMVLNRRAQIALLLSVSAIAVAADKQCVQFELPIPVVATNEHYNIRRVDNDIDSVQWALDNSVWNQNMTETTGLNITKMYDINAELCIPTQKTEKSDILQIAVHGNGWDKRCVAQ
jgi:hypothetical protein